MPNWSADGEDSCGCTFGRDCAFHQVTSRSRRAQERAAMRSKGLNPDASVEGLEGLVFMVGCSQALSENQKDAIMRILFPLGRPR